MDAAAPEQESRRGVERPSPQASTGGLATEQGIYGVILVAGLIVVSGMNDVLAITAFVTVISTVLVFWAAHVFAGVVAHWTDNEKARLGHSLGHAFRQSWALLVAALVPSAILLAGVTNAVSDDSALWAALIVCVAMLAVLGFTGFRRRGSSLFVCIVGALATSSFGLLMIGLKVFLH